MSVPDAAIPPHWQYYSDRARDAHHGRADDFGKGREEQLDETLRFIESGKPFTEEAKAALDRVPHNRAKKYTRLRLHIFQAPVISYCDDQEPLIDRVHEVLKPAEWLVECLLAEGEGYAAIAGAATVASLKMKVSRWRARVREAVAL